MKRLRLTHDQMADLLSGKAITVVYEGQRGVLHGESYPVSLHEPTEVRAIVKTSALAPRSTRKWNLSVELDRAAPAMLLNAESKGGVIIPLETGDERDPAAHGYRSEPGRKVLDAGEAIPHSEVMTFAKSQSAARELADAKVDSFQKRRARTLGRRVEDALMKARAHGAEPDVERLETWLGDLEESTREAAA